MNISQNQDVLSLESEYIDMKRSLFKRFVKFLIALFLLLCSVETFRAVVQLKYVSLIHVPILICFALFAYKLLQNPSKDQDFSSTILCIAFYLYGVGVNYYGNIGYFETPIDAFYFAYVCAIIERLTTKNIPTVQYRILYSACATIIRLIIVPPNQKSTYLRQILFLCLHIYVDLDKEKCNKALLRSYFSNKDQLVKFKDLLVHDIPEGIAIISKSLMEELFLNTAFKKLIDGTGISHLRNLLNQLIVHETAPSANSSCNGSTANVSGNSIPEQITLLEFIERKFNRISRDKPLLENTKEKVTCNVTYKTKTIKEQDDNDVKQEEHIFEVKIFPITWDGESSLAIILHDITQQRTILSLQLADVHKDTVLATVSHELRTPLNGMLGMIQIMQKRIHDTELLQFLSICKNSGELLLGLVNSILDLNQIRAKKIQLYPEQININELLKGVLCLFDFQCKQKGITLTTKVSSMAPKYIFSDKNRLTQIFINLVGNALKFTSKGEITITAKDSREKEYIQFSVEDTGIGIKDEDQSRLFQRFEKLNSTTNKNMNRQGVGLGLTISDSLVKLLKGTKEDRGITIKSQYGEGSIFSFKIRKSLGEEMSEPENIDPRELESFGADSFRDNMTSIMQKMKTYASLEVSPNKLLRNNFSQHTRRCSTSNISLLPANISSLSHSKPKIRVADNIKNSYILIVDDNPFNLVVAESLISYYGYRIKTALDGQTAINTVTSNKHEIEHIKMILMDCEMPMMNGYETSMRLNELMTDRKIPYIPIVALTANTGDSDKAKCLRAGMADRLTKPLKDVELQKILAKFG